MKRKAEWAWAAVAVISVAAGAQTMAANGAASGAGSAQSSGAQTSAATGEYGAATAQAGPPPTIQATRISAELARKIDSKDAKVGDEVVAKTTAEAQLSDGTKLPRGSKLVGHVTDVQAKSHDNHDSHLTFAFDHAVLKDGHEVQILAMMRSIAAPAPMVASSGSDDMMGGGGVQGGGGARGGAGGGGGVGLANSASGTVRGATGPAAGTTAAAAGGLNNATAGTDNAANGTLGAAGDLGANGAALGSAAGASVGSSGPAMPVGNLSAVTFNTVSATAGASQDGVNGSAGASTATVLTGHGKNVSLDSGSQMTLSVAPR
jgi:hypothetical protein